MSPSNQVSDSPVKNDLIAGGEPVMNEGGVRNQTHVSKSGVHKILSRMFMAHAMPSLGDGRAPWWSTLDSGHSSSMPCSQDIH